jgi:hypothetical protein
MRFFASWWERIPVRQIAPALLPVLVVAGTFGQLIDLIRSILGFGWN